MSDYEARTTAQNIRDSAALIRKHARTIYDAGDVEQYQYWLDQATSFDRLAAIIEPAKPHEVLLVWRHESVWAECSACDWSLEVGVQFMVSSAVIVANTHVEEQAT